MAAGYRTASPVFVDDKMMQMPWELMAQVINKKDAEIDLSMGEASALQDMLKIKSLAKDKDRANELTAQYDDEVYNITQSILKNPLEHQKELHRIRNLSRKLGQDMNQGEWGAIQGNYDQHMAESKRIAELKNSEGYNDPYKSALVNDKLSKYEGVNYNPDGSYNQYGSIDAMALGDMNDWVEKKLKGAMPDAESIEQDTLNGGWKYRVKNEWKTMSEDQLASILGDAFEGDTATRNAIKQRAELNLDGFSNLLDADSNLVPMVGMGTREVTDANGKKVEVPQLSFGNNFVGNAFRAGVTKFGFTENTTSQTMTVDGYAMANYKSKLAEDKDIRKEQRQTDYVRVLNKENITSHVPNDVTAFHTEQQRLPETIAAIKTQATEYLKNKYGKELSDAEKKAIDLGDFTALYAAGISPDAIAPLEQQYQESAIKLGALNAAQATWTANMTEKYDSNNAMKAKDNPDGFKNYLKQEEANWSQFLEKAANTSMDIASSWEATGLNKNQIESFQKQVKDGKHYERFEFDYQGNKVTIADLINQGVVRPVQSKVQGGGSSSSALIEEQQTISATPESRRSADQKARLKEITKQIAVAGSSANKVSYEFVNGNGFINLDVSKESIMPTTGFDDDNKINVGMNVVINGTPVYAKLGSDVLSSSGIETMKQVHGQTFAFNSHMARLGTVNNFTLPHAPGVILNGINKTIITGPGRPPLPTTHGEGLAAAKALLGYN